jgi:hypothetical protein
MTRTSKERTFMTNADEQALARALTVLRQVTQRLAQGIKKETFEREFRGKYVSPGVTVQQYVRELRLSGSLEETGSTIKLKPVNDPVAA